MQLPRTLGIALITEVLIQHVTLSCGSMVKLPSFLSVIVHPNYNGKEGRNLTMIA